MGNKQEKPQFEGDVRFMEGYKPGSGQICKRWSKKHGFKGKLDTTEILGLQASLKEEMLKIKNKKKKKKRQEQYEFSTAWLNQSKERDRAREKKRKEKEKREETRAMLVKEDEETQRGTEKCDQSETEEEVEDRLSTYRSRKRRADGRQRPEPKQRPEPRVKLDRKAKHKGRSGHTLYPSVELKDALVAFRDGAPERDTEESEEESDEEAEITRCPRIQVANPNTGADQPPTITVYRPWTQNDMRKATEGIIKPSHDIEEYIKQVLQLKDSFQLDGVEMERVFLMTNTHRWCRVKGDYTGKDGGGNPRLHTDAQLTAELEALWRRMRTEYAQTANYSKIGECLQKSGEAPPDYLARLELVFRANSGITYDTDEKSAYQQQLKNAFLNGLEESTRRGIEKLWVNRAKGTVDEAVAYARHVEGNKKKKKEEDSAGVFMYQTSYQARGRGRNHFQGRGRGQPRGRGRSGNYDKNDRNYEIDKQKNLCFICHEKGHFARDCPQGQA